MSNDVPTELADLEYIELHSSHAFRTWLYVDVDGIVKVYREVLPAPLAKEAPSANE